MFLNFPKAVPLILFTIFLERYSSGGINATLALFFNRKLGFDPSLSTALFHAYEFAVFAFTIFAAIVADSWLGHYKTLLSMSFVYAVGASLLSIGTIDPLNLPITVFTAVGLVIAIVGVGSIKCNSNTFAADQYKLPEQAKQLSLYFSLQYFCMKSGSIIGRFFNPIMRADVDCFGMHGCFPLSFGVPALAMILSVLILYCGRSLYAHKPLTENMVVKVCGCILNAIKEKIKHHKTQPRNHWLDYAQQKYGITLVEDTKSSLNVLIMLVPIPVFWTLHMQQTSRFVFQAARMDGNLGFYTIKPDQMIIFNSLFSILLVPVFERVIYPIINRLGVTTALRKISCGLFIAASAFVIAAFIEMRINSHESVHILYLIPQYAVLVMAEIMVYIQCMDFAYSEAPSNMKSVMVAFVYLTMALGNLFMVFISGSRIFESQVHEFLFFAGLMAIDTFLFIFLAVKYNYVNRETK